MENCKVLKKPSTRQESNQRLFVRIATTMRNGVMSAYRWLHCDRTVPRALLNRGFCHDPTVIKHLVFKNFIDHGTFIKLTDSVVS